jgi:hypothetical protein
MIQRLALLIGGVGAAAVLAFALGLTNFVFAGPGTAVTTAASPGIANGSDPAAVGDGQRGAGNQSVQPQKTVVDKVYIAPTPAPKVVHPRAPSHPSTGTPSTGRQHQGQQSDSAGRNGGGRGRGDD